MKRKQKSAREKVAEYLWKLGYKLNEDEIFVIRGPKKYQDILECWRLYCTSPDGKPVEITSGYTLTQCAKGFELILNPSNSDFYGDYITQLITNTK